MSNITRTSATCFMRRAALALVVVSLGAVCARAQGSVPNAVQGFSQNRDKPIHIDAAQLEVRDKDRVATFSGDVKVVQGDTTMRARTLQVFYDQQAPQAAKGVQTPAPKSVLPGPAGGNSQIRRLEAKGNVIVTQKDQVVTGETGVFDMRANTVTVTGGVVLTRGEDVLKGDRLVVNMATGISKIEMDAGRRVNVLINPKSGDGKGPAVPGLTPTPERKDGGRDTKAPGNPMRLNAFPAYSRPAG
jgi:lipopolysaccharide export system protein LptA